MKRNEENIFEGHKITFNEFEHEIDSEELQEWRDYIKTLARQEFEYRKFLIDHKEDKSFSVTLGQYYADYNKEWLASYLEIDVEELDFNKDSFDLEQLQNKYKEFVNNYFDTDYFDQVKIGWNKYMWELKSSYKEYYINEIKKTDIIEKDIIFNNDNNEKEFIIKHFSPRAGQTETTGTVIYFHGGPGYACKFDELNKDFILKIINDFNYNFFAVEVAGSAEVGDIIDDLSLVQKPNYVDQIKTILNYIKTNYPEDSNKEYIGISHSFGSYQLFNYLRFEGENSGLSKIFSSSGDVSGGAQDFLDNIRYDDKFINSEDWHLKIKDYKFSLGLPIYIKNYSKSKLYDTKYSHSIVNLTQENNVVINKDLNKSLSPFYHLDKLPKIPYLFEVGTHDEKVHASHSIEVYRSLKAKGYNAELLLIEGGGHSSLFIECALKEEHYKLVSKGLEDFLRGVKIQDNSNISLEERLKNLKFYEGSALDKGYDEKLFFDYFDWNKALEEWQLANFGDGETKTDNAQENVVNITGAGVESAIDLS